MTVKNENILDEILEHNQKFVKNKDYLKHITSGMPDRNMVVISCMDTRLTALLPDALGIKNGDVKMIKNAGGIVTSPIGGVMRSVLVALYAFNITNVVIIGHEKCGMASVDNSHLLEKMKERGIDESTFKTLEYLKIDVNQWLAGFDNVDEAIKDSVSLVRNHPLVAKDVRVYGLVINPETGELRVV